MGTGMTKDERNLWRVVRIIGLIIFVIVMLFMWVFNPGVNKDNFSSETLWEAVHPYHAFFDTVALLGTVCTFIYLLGFAGKFYGVVEPKSENSLGATKIVFWILVVAQLLYFV